MILPFSTKLNGKETFFVEKILKYFLLENETKNIKAYDWVADAIYEAGVHLKYEYADDILDKVDQCKPKLHTIREDKKDRWHAGIMIDFFINVRQKNMFRFAPKVAVVSTQEIFMTYAYNNRIDISIDDRELYGYEKEDFAINDGFDTWNDFFDYFYPKIKESEKQFYKGKIIHWTDLRY